MILDLLFGPAGTAVGWMCLGGWAHIGWCRWQRRRRYKAAAKAFTQAMAATRIHLPTDW